MASSLEDQEPERKVREIEFLSYSIRFEVVKKNKPKKQEDSVEMRSKKKMTACDIGMPNNFKHLSHVGLNPFGSVSAIIQRESEIVGSQIRNPSEDLQLKSVRQKRTNTFDGIAEDNESLAEEAFHLSNSFEFNFDGTGNDLSSNDFDVQTKEPGRELRRATSVRARTMLFENFNVENHQSLPTLQPRASKMYIKTNQGLKI